MAKQIKTQAQQTLPSAAKHSTAKKTDAEKAAAKAARKAAWDKLTPEQKKAERAARKARTAAKAPKLLLERLAKARKILGAACALVAGVPKDDGDGFPAAQVLLQASDAVVDATNAFASIIGDGWAPPAAPKRARLGKTIEVGAKVEIRAKRRAEFEGVLAAAEMTGMEVVKINKGIAYVKTVSGDKVMIARAKLQLVKVEAATA